MSGISDDSLVYGILDLIRKEMAKQNNSTTVEGDPFEGTPHVLLRREYPGDSDILTSVRLFYPSKWLMNITLNYGLSVAEIEEGLKRNQAESYDPLTLEEGEDFEGAVLPEYNQLPASEQGASESEGELSEGNRDSNPRGVTYPLMPMGMVDDTHPDYVFVTQERLNSVTFEAYTPENTLHDTYNIRLYYDYKNYLTGTIVERI